MPIIDSTDKKGYSDEGAYRVDKVVIHKKLTNLVNIFIPSRRCKSNWIPAPYDEPN